MSLINEALKRAQAEKQRQDQARGPAGEQAVTAGPPIVAAGGPGVDEPFKVTTVAVIRPPQELADAGTSTRAVFGFTAGALAMVVLCLATLWLRDQRVKSVSASEAPPVGEQPVQVDAAGPVDSTELALETIEQQLEASASQAPAGPALPASLPAPTPAAASPGDASALFTPAAPPEAPAPTTRPESVADRFTLGGIISSIEGESMATINGKLLRVGETIDGGTLLRIQSQSVEMESAGQRFTLRM